MISIIKINKDTVVTRVDLTKASKGDLAHLLCELERLKKKVLDKWDSMD